MSSKELLKKVGSTSSFGFRYIRNIVYDNCHIFREYYRTICIPNYSHSSLSIKTHQQMHVRSTWDNGSAQVVVGIEHLLLINVALSHSDKKEKKKKEGVWKSADHRERLQADEMLSASIRHQSLSTRVTSETQALRIWGQGRRQLKVLLPEHVCQSFRRQTDTKSMMKTEIRKRSKRKYCTYLLNDGKWVGN